VIVDCAHYRDGRRQHEGRMELGRAAEICLQDDGFIWLGLFEPDPARWRRCRRALGCTSSRSRTPRTTTYDPRWSSTTMATSCLPCSARPATSMTVRTSTFGEVSVFVSRGFVITVRQGVASDLHHARLRLEDRPELLSVDGYRQWVPNAPPVMKILFRRGWSGCHVLALKIAAWYWPSPKF